MNIELEFALWLCVVALCAMPVGAFQYKRILMMCAKQRTAEKLLDGNFYYIIPESEYVEFICLKNAHGVTSDMKQEHVDKTAKQRHEENT